MELLDQNMWIYKFERYIQVAYIKLYFLNSLRVPEPCFPNSANIPMPHKNESMEMYDLKLSSDSTFELNHLMQFCSLNQVSPYKNAGNWLLLVLL